MPLASGLGGEAPSDSRAEGREAVPRFVAAASSSPETVVVDHGAGNLGSVVRALRRQGADVHLSSDPERIANAKRLVLPGDGHFGEAMRALRERGLETPLRQAVGTGTWLLGICVGLQMLFPDSDEAPGVRGLGLLPGRVRRFGGGMLVPHIGWNQLEGIGSDPLSRGLLREIPEGGYAYFLHSFYAETSVPHQRLAATEYGVRFASAAGEGRVFGIQFHPEKSGRLGAAVLANFLALGARQ